jgi:hypothetical protein
MSGQLKIRPCDKKGIDLSFELKKALQKKMLRLNEFIVDENDIKYFQGLYDAGLEDARIVLDFIEKHGECEIFIVY